jgi:acyl-CoA synthetase (NDP forming)
VINYLDGVALWPFAHGGACPGYGAAIITQSGMLSSDLTMSQRSVPFAFMVSAGNQSVVTLEDFVDILSGHPGVRAIGLHIEGIRDVARFSEAALRALGRSIPVVALKTGTSEIGAHLTISHTGSLSGTDDLYQALFDRLGIIRVTTPAHMLETLKFLCVAGVPGGNRIAGLTCSGGSAAMLADYAETIGLAFPPPTRGTAERLAQCLPYTATVSNPLDYTTPIWGIPERTRPVFESMLRESYAAAVLVQDYPLAGLDESKPH